MEDSEEGPSAPVLSDDGAQRIREAIARHERRRDRSHAPTDSRHKQSKGVDAQAASNRWQNPKRDEFSLQDWSEEPGGERHRAGADTTAPAQQSGPARVLVVVAAILIPLIVGAAAVQFGRERSEGTVTAEVAGVVTSRGEDGESGQVGIARIGSAEELDDARGKEVFDSQLDAVAQSDESSATTNESEASAVSQAPIVPSEGLELIVFDSDEGAGEPWTFAVRIVSPPSAVETVSTSTLRIELEADGGEDVDIAVSFVHEDIPPGSSAVASVLTQAVPIGDLTVVLSSGEVELDRVALR